MNSGVSTIFGIFPIVPTLSWDIIKTPWKYSLNLSAVSKALKTLSSDVSPVTSLAILVASPSPMDGLLLITVTLSDFPKLMEWPILPEDVQMPSGFFLAFISKPILFPKISLFEKIPQITF